MIFHNPQHDMTFHHSLTNGPSRFRILFLAILIILTTFSSKILNFTKTEIKFLQAKKYTPEALALLSRKSCFSSLNFTTPNVEIKPNLGSIFPKFLLTIPFGGPSNQILGFQEAAKLAAALGRHLVAPPLYFHETDKTHSTSLHFVPPQIRINYESFEENIFATVQDFKNNCNSSNTVIFNTQKTRSFMVTRAKEFEASTGIYFQNNPKQFPTLDQFPVSGRLEKDELLRAYVGNNEHKCVIVNQIYNNIPITRSERQSVSKSPVYLKTLFTEFLEKNNVQKIDVGLHWRYDCNDAVIGQSKSVDIHMEMLHYEKIAEYLIQLFPEAVNYYVAAVSAQRAQVRALADAMGRVSGGEKRIFVHDDLNGFFDEFYGDCGLFEDYYGEIFALVEQQVLVNAEHFCQWPKSSYSSLVKEMRVGEGREGVHRFSLYQILLDSKGF